MSTKKLLEDSSFSKRVYERTSSFQFIILRILIYFLNSSQAKQQMESQESLESLTNLFKKQLKIKEKKIDLLNCKLEKMRNLLVDQEKVYLIQRRHYLRKIAKIDQQIQRTLGSKSNKKAHSETKTAESFEEISPPKHCRLRVK